MTEHWNRWPTEVSIPGYIQTLTAFGPEQHSIADPASSSRVGLDDVQRCLPTTAHSINI